MTVEQHLPDLPVVLKGTAFEKAHTVLTEILHRREEFQRLAQDFSPGDPVRITGGPYAHLELRGSVDWIEEGQITIAFDKDLIKQHKLSEWGQRYYPVELQKIEPETENTSEV